MRTLIENIAEIAAVRPGPVRGPAMDAVPRTLDAALVIEDAAIAWFGPRSAAPAGPFDAVVDADGGAVVPGFVDCHTHAVFAGSREGEFVERIRGRTYLEILEAGGGIHRTVEATRSATEDELVRIGAARLARMLAAGSTTVEIKSGYGLSPEHELKMLRAIRRLGRSQPVEVVGSYLAAHAVPREFAGRADAYLDSVLEDGLLERLYAEDLAEFADVFCERGAFETAQAERFLRTCARHGLRPKLHADQITQCGASRLGERLGAVSVDHLEKIDAECIAPLRGSQTIPVLLPGCSFFLNTKPAPARALIDAGLPVALATDCNPGSSPIESMSLILSLACCLLRMTPAEALTAATANAAAALGRADRIGAIAVGHQADLLVLDVPNVERLASDVGRNPVRIVFKRGHVVHPPVADSTVKP